MATKLSFWTSLFSVFSFCSFWSPVQAQISAKEIVTKSIEYHDPKGLLLTERLTLGFEESRPNGIIQKSSLVIDLPKEYISITRYVDNAEVKMIWNKGLSLFSINGNTELNQDQIDKYSLNKDRLIKMKDYYRYLWHMPLTLLDPGTIIDKTVKEQDFNEHKSYQIRVTYDPSTGNDIWYFYFDKETYALIGYRFYHDETANDGEYILLFDEYQYKHLRLPQKRAWYTHKEDKFLGQDKLVKVAR